MKRILTAFTILLLIIGCEPAKIEGDVFLVKGDGKPQPSAAKEVIFVKAESFEDILIKSYLESAQIEVKRKAEIISNICVSASAIMMSEKEKTQEFLNGRIASGKANNVIGQDGTCASLQKQFDDASLAAIPSRSNYDQLKTSAMAELKKLSKNKENLQNKLQQKISSREKYLYEDFNSGIEIKLQNNRWGRGHLKVLNNTKYNIRVEGDICLQYFNAEGSSVGHVGVRPGILDDGCDYYHPDRRHLGDRAIGTLLKSSAINTAYVSKDEFGFDKGGYLPKGSEIWAGGNNYFCKWDFSPSEILRLTRKYGTDKGDWPDLSSPDPSKGYKFLTVNYESSWREDTEACGITDQEGIAKFIPLEDEVRRERGNTIRYVSQPINFRNIAAAEIYEERDLIKAQEELIITAKNKIRSITNQSIENPLLAEEANAESKLDQCSQVIAANESDKQTIGMLDDSLEQTEQCNVNDAGLINTLMSVAISAETANQLDSILEIDYGSKAAYAALKIFADSKYKSSTNISGHYVMDLLPRGNYVVFSYYIDNFNEGVYLDNIEITGKAQIVDLNNTNFHKVGSLSRVIDIFYENCEDVICSESDLRHTLDLNKAERRY